MSPTAAQDKSKKRTDSGDKGKGKAKETTDTNNKGKDKAKATRPEAPNKSSASSSKARVAGGAKKAQDAADGAKKRNKPKFVNELKRLKSTVRGRPGGGGGTGRGLGFALDPLPEFSTLMGSVLRMPLRRHVHEDASDIIDILKLNSSDGIFTPLLNVTTMLRPKDFFTDEASCAMDAFNLAVGQA